VARLEAGGELGQLGRRQQQTTLQGLAEEAQLRIEAPAAAHHHHIRLTGTALTPPLLQQISGVNQAGAAMQAQGAPADQTGISPGEGFLQHAPIATAADLGRASLRRGQAAIKADREN
jgi:hypothetical protein